LLEAVLLGQALPTLLVFALGLVLFRLVLPGASERARSLILIVLSWVGYLIGHYVTMGMPAQIVPTTPQETLLAAFSLSCIWAVFSAFARGNHVAFYVGRFLMSLILINMMKPFWSFLQGKDVILYVFAFCVLWFVSDRALRRIVSSAPSYVAPLVMILVLTGISLTNLMSGSASTAQLVGSMCAVLGGIALVLFLSPKQPLRLDILIPTFTLYMTSSFYNSFYFVEIKLPLLILVLFSLVVAVVAARFAFPQRAAIFRSITILALSAIPVAAAVLWCAYQQSLNSGGY
jgi:hypothetical protein